MSFLSDLASDISSALSDIAVSITYVASGVTYTCSGWSQAIDLTKISASGVMAGDLAVSIFVATLSITPKLGDRIIIDGRPRTVISVARDTASTMWSLQVRG